MTARYCLSSTGWTAVLKEAAEICPGERERENKSLWLKLNSLFCFLKLIFAASEMTQQVKTLSSTMTGVQSSGLTLEDNTHSPKLSFGTPYCAMAQAYVHAKNSSWFSTDTCTRVLKLLKGSLTSLSYARGSTGPNSYFLKPYLTSVIGNGFLCY